MRKKTISYWFDTFMWYLIYLLPLVCFVILLFKSGAPLTLSAALNNCGLGVLTDNIVVTTMSQIFGAGGVIPLFASADLIIYFSYFICCMIIHLAVDVLLFIPRYAHHLMDCFGGKHE